MLLRFTNRRQPETQSGTDPQTEGEKEANHNPPQHQEDPVGLLLDEYAILRVDHSPREACRILAAQFHREPELIRRILGQKQGLRICRRCWEEYAHHHSRTVHLCDACRKETRLMYDESVRDLPAGFRRRHNSRYMTDERRLNRAIRLLMESYKLTRAEAIRFISEVQESERIIMDGERRFHGTE